MGKKFTIMRLASLCVLTSLSIFNMIGVSKLSNDITVLSDAIKNNEAMIVATDERVNVVDGILSEISVDELNNTQPVEEILEEPVTQSAREIEELPYTDDEIYLMAKVCLAEAEDQTELGKKLVVSTILNRVDSNKYANNVYDVIHQPWQFEVMHNGRIDRVTVTDDIIELVKSEIRDRTNYDVIYFRMDHYSEYGTPLFVEDDHYFSGL